MIEYTLEFAGPVIPMALMAAGTIVQSATTLFQGAAAEKAYRFEAAQKVRDAEYKKQQAKTIGMETDTAVEDAIDEGEVAMGGLASVVAASHVTQSSAGDLARLQRMNLSRKVNAIQREGRAKETAMEHSAHVDITQSKVSFQTGKNARYSSYGTALGQGLQGAAMAYSLKP
jgi:hypothetical protein